MWKDMLKRYTVVSLLIGYLGLSALQAQNYVVSPVVPDFTDITASCVEATYGTTADPFENKGIVSGRHTVISRQGTDPWTGGQLKLLPDHESKVVRLGNPNFYAEAESITYHFKVDEDRAVLLLKFAVVFQDPSHPHLDQPRFIVRIMNAEGALIEACAEYDISASAGIEGFQTYERGGTPVRWRDWTSVGLDMSAYAGKEVQVQFVTYDCAYQAHFGYAYFTATCVSHQLSLDACGGDSFTVSAPEGFQSYLWQDGRTVSSTEWTKQGADMNLSCEITSATGCHFTLSAFITSGQGVPVGAEFYDTVCQGEPYRRNNYDLPFQKYAGTYCYYNTYFDVTGCNNKGKTTLYLTVSPRYYPVEAELCPGESYREYGFVYERPAPGVYYDTLWYTTSSRCDSAVVLHLTVYPEVTMSSSIRGEAYPCVGSTQVYAVTEAWEAGSYAWQFPPGFYVMDGQGTSRVTVQVTDAARKGQVSLFFGAGGCAVGPDPFIVDPRPAYWPMWSDTLCSGLEYHDRGFDLPHQDTAGIYTFVRYLTSVSGCDSVVTLVLSVAETPSVRVEVSDSVLCGSTEVQLYTVKKDALMIIAPEPEVAIGDILCRDGSIVKPEKYTSLHDAQGIVFWVNKDGKHGWVVELRDKSPACIWSYSSVNVAGLPDRITNRDAIGDTLGYESTRILRSMGGNYEAASLVDFAKGWYLPAIGQLLQLYSVIPEVNASLTVVGGQPFEFADAEWYYWSSSEYTDTHAWALFLKGYQVVVPKRPVPKGRLRAIRSF